jgi:hypothetical protein
LTRSEGDDPAQNGGVSFWDKVQVWFRREKAELDESVADGHVAMDRLEREQAATPEEKLRLEQERAAASDAEYEALRKRIEGN